MFGKWLEIEYFWCWFLNINCTHKIKDKKEKQPNSTFVSQSSIYKMLKLKITEFTEALSLSASMGNEVIGNNVSIERDVA